MNYLHKKKLAFMSIVNKVKGFVRRVSGIPPLTLPDCVDTDSLIDYAITGKTDWDLTEVLATVANHNETVTNREFYNTPVPTPKLLLEPNTTYHLKFEYVINSATKRMQTSVGFGENSYVNDIKQKSWTNQNIGEKAVFEMSFTTPNHFYAWGTTTEVTKPYLQLRLTRCSGTGTWNVDISNVCIAKEIKGVGEKTRNIWYPSVDALTSNGITCTRNNDNTYTVNGTATADFYFHIGKITIEVGTTYYLSGGTSQAPIAFQLREGSTGVTTLYNYGGITTFSPTGEHSIDIINCVIVVRSGVAVNNIVVKPMISLENTDDYEPYGYKIPVKCSGKNLFDSSKYWNIHATDVAAGYGGYAVTKIDGGVKIARNSSAGWSNDIVGLEPNTTYTVSFKAKTAQGGTNYIVISVDKKLYYKYMYAATTSTLTQTFTTDGSPSAFGFAHSNSTLSSGTASTLEITDIMLVKGSTVTDYEPYVKPVTTNIYLDKPLAEGETLKNPVKLPTVKGTTIYTIGTGVQPKNISATYYSTRKD